MVAVAEKIEPGVDMLLSGVSWRFYEEFLRGLGERRLFVTYDNGEMEIMSPLPAHEYLKGRVSRLLNTMFDVREIDAASYGGMTFKRKDLAKGVEPDDCLWIQNEWAVRGKTDLDLRRIPPPDLVIEIEQTQTVIDRLSIFAAFGVPEVWTYDGQELTLRQLKRGVYRVAKSSRNFPFLPLNEFAQFLKVDSKEAPTALTKRFAAWVREL